jgi:hypothetical protein
VIIGQKVIVLTRSGTFQRAEGRVTSTMRGGAMVRLNGEPTPLYFVASEIVPASEHSHHAGAE